MLVLGIETSCDETSAAILDDDKVLSNIIATQAIHEDFGGVVPEFASRAHTKTLNPIILQALKKADKSFVELDAIAVTYGPGLAGSLLVGLGVAKGLSMCQKIPFVGVNHIEGHILANFVNQQEIPYPFLCLVASGGHTLLVHVPEPLQYDIIGQTIDDAAGEAFDKVAKILELGYPGGPIIEKTALTGNARALDFPIGLAKKDNLDFSFSGLKTAVLYYAQSLTRDELLTQINDIAASFQSAVIESLLIKSIKAVKSYKCKNFILAGGVARNNTLRKRFESELGKLNVQFSVPSPEMCTDNAAMIARAGVLRMKHGQFSSNDLDVYPNLSLK